MHMRMLNMFSFIIYSTYAISSLSEFGAALATKKYKKVLLVMEKIYRIREVLVMLSVTV